MTEKDLLKLKEKIEKAKTQMSETKGIEKTLMKRLKDEYNCKDLSEAKIKLKSIEKEIDTLTIKIQNEIETLEEILEENEI